MRDSLVRILGKGSKERLAHLESPVTREALQSYLKIRGTLLNPSEARSSESPLFLNRFGNRISEQSVRAIVRNRAHRAGVTAHITPHMFRHTFATMLLEDNVNLRYIQSFLGHSSVKTTERYTHVAQVRQREILRNHNPREIIDRNMRNALLG